ncbi:hypothetical protein BACCAP_04129 [Pseudoflavonifractor capillosus ATCC 29799]|uniref:Uncharacterized protein n=1 Tax=Pseudoflavonifractor capillosus ATCC 29799 TaxID=411467 RepID=A6P0W3_9FIRM|nr:hypothetical protein BACCAP_04129 [Pseudoflavonifractor capillosus ATCC 29799]
MCLVTCPKPSAMYVQGIKNTPMEHTTVPQMYRRSSAAATAARLHGFQRNPWPAQFVL